MFVKSFKVISNGETKKEMNIDSNHGKVDQSSITVLSSKTHDSQPFLLYHVSCHVMSDLGGHTTKEVLSLPTTNLQANYNTDQTNYLLYLY